MSKIDKLIDEALKKKDILNKILEDKNADVRYVNNEGKEGNYGVDFLEVCDKLGETKSIKALLCLLDFFENRFDIEANGVLESLQSNIENNFSVEQILAAFQEKFSDFVEKNLRRCVFMSEAFFCKEKFFKKFRIIFNVTKSIKSDEFTKKISENFGEYLNDDIKQRIDLLREDMKKW